ncbi:MAG: type II toxin-antitoxin system VapC family toxin [Nanoarchaeota archaeon]|nr:type II toxin-antitoxin system VapC family toxin [Nanoarchaeota archaeon]
MKIYVDSNVLISIVLSDFGKNLEFMSLRSQELIERVLACEYAAVISDLTVEEFEKITKLSKADLKELFKTNPHKLEIISVEQRDINRVKELSKLGVKGKKDCIHAAIALRTKCDVICTWNIPDFKAIKNLIRVLKPSEL